HSHDGFPVPKETAIMAVTRWARLLTLLAVALVLCRAGATQAGGKSDQEKFQGDWLIVTAIKGGDAIPPAFLKAAKANFKGDKITIEVAGESYFGIAKLDETKKPKEVDLTVEGQLHLGIYKVEGDDLTVCLAAPKEPRPTKFESPAKTGTFLVVFRRPD